MTGCPVGPALRFTFVDLLAAVVVLALCGAAAAPAVSAANERDRRVRCATNLRQLGQAIQLYANENKGSLPRTRFDPGGAGRVRAFTNWKAKEPFAADGPEPNDVTAAIYLLIRTQDISPEQFVCPSGAATPLHFGPAPLTTDALRAAQEVGVPDPVAAEERGREEQRKPPEQRRREQAEEERTVAAAERRAASGPPAAARKRDISNFPSARNLGYGYTNPYPSRRAIDVGLKLNYSLDSDFAVMADINPGGPAVAAVKAGEMPPADGHPNVASTGWKFTDAMRKANSPNHDGFGQNVLYADGHVRWQPTPFCGRLRGEGDRAQRDNIYTRHLGQPGDPAPAGNQPGGAANLDDDPIVGPSMDPQDSVILPVASPAEGPKPVP